MTNKGIAIFLLLIGVLFAGCSQGAVARMRGTYVNKDRQATLQVTSDKMVVTGDPLTITVEYKVLSVTGANVAIELTVPNPPEGNIVGNAAVTVGDNSIVFEGHGLLGGTWTRM
jgi:hypothetical protein